MLTGKKGQGFGRLPPDLRKGRSSFARAAGAYVPKLTARAFEKYGFHSAEIMTDWARIAGAEIASWTQPERIRWPRGPQGEDETGGTGRPGGSLVLRVEPARALDVEYRAAQIIDRINRYFGYRAVETLKLIQAPLDRPEPVPAPLRADPRRRGEGASAGSPKQGAGSPIASPLPGQTGTLSDLAHALARLAESVRTERTRR